MTVTARYAGTISSANLPPRRKYGRSFICANCCLEVSACLCFANTKAMGEWADTLRRAACYVRARARYGDLGRPSTSIPCALAGVSESSARGGRVPRRDSY